MVKNISIKIVMASLCLCTMSCNSIFKANKSVDNGEIANVITYDKPGTQKQQNVDVAILAATEGVKTVNTAKAKNRVWTAKNSKNSKKAKVSDSSKNSKSSKGSVGEKSSKGSVSSVGEKNITLPEIVTQTEKVDQVKETEKIDVALKNTVVKTKLEPYKIVFTVGESTNIRYAGRDPFAESNPVIIDPKLLKDEFFYPCDGKVISNYGSRGSGQHAGVDIKCRVGETIYTILPGVVRVSKSYSGYGNIVIIHHYNGMESVYAHLSKSLVAVNQVVEAEEAIGIAGRTGRATTEHLHLELRLRGDAFDPGLLIDYNNRSLNKEPLYAYYNGRVQVFNKPQSDPQLLSVQKVNIATDDDLKEDDAIKASASEVVSASKIEQTTKVSEDQKPKVQPKAKVAAKVTTKYHKVVKGDTLYCIAKKYGTTAAKISKLNGLKNQDKIKPGQKLKVK